MLITVGKGVPEMQEMQQSNNPINTLFYSGSDVTSSRVLYTPSSFARSSLLWLQEAGHLTALRPHVSGRDHLSSYLFFMVLDGAGWLEYNGVHYELCEGDMCFIDCRKGYSQSSSEDLWIISWCHMNGPSMPAIYNKYCERGGRPVFHPEESSVFISLLNSLYTTASSESYIRDVEINSLLNELVGLLFAETVYEENEDRPAVNVGSVDRIDVGEIKSYIDTHYQDPLSLELLADHFHFNKNYVSRCFKEAYGMSVGSYIGLVRVGGRRRGLGSHLSPSSR
ncbi:MAG: AraC family transcriptional regulator [Lachnospiraceae bacterium]|nr:AraC family transcriptional regulator [Lachnospiraceae bacterium]